MAFLQRKVPKIIAVFGTNVALAKETSAETCRRASKKDIDFCDGNILALSLRGKAF